MEITLRRIGEMSWQVSHNGLIYGRVWRSRNGWVAVTPDGHKVLENFHGSKTAAAKALIEGKPDNGDRGSC